MAKTPKISDNDPNPIDVLSEQVKELQGHVLALSAMVDQQDSGNVDRIDNLEDGAENQFPDFPFAEVADRPGEPPDIKVQTNPDNGLSEGDMLPNEIEWGIPTADITADSATVTLQPCDEAGVEYADADTVTLYVCDDRSEQALIGRGWIATIPAVPEDPPDPAEDAIPGTIISFLRLPVFGPDADGVLVGEAPADGFYAVLRREHTDRDGSYDQWAEVEANGAGTFDIKTGGRTDEGETIPLWETNLTRRIPTLAIGAPPMINNYVWVNVVGGVAGGRYTFDWHNKPFPIILAAETNPPDGSYDEWDEYEGDSLNPPLGPKSFGARSENNTGMIAWEANKTIGIPIDTIVWAHIERHAVNGATLVFDYQIPPVITVEGDDIWTEGSGTSPDFVVSHIGPNHSTSGFYFQFICLAAQPSGIYDGGTPVSITSGPQCIGGRFDIKGHLFATLVAAGGWVDWDN